jgi:Cu(I)/Ag(I) efflux system membrane protein CusA/SilA
MSRIAAPMVGGMISAVILTLLVLPALFYLWRVNTLEKILFKENTVKDKT